MTRGTPSIDHPTSAHPSSDPNTPDHPTSDLATPDLATVGWYIHHHGAGHLTRFLAARPHLDTRVVVFSSLAAPDRLPRLTEWVRLDRDDEAERDASGTVIDPRDASPTVAGLLHWAPLAHRGHTSRMSVIASALAATAFAAFVVDVSVEVTLLVRMLGVRPIVVTQPGDRNDLPHDLAYRAAERILAPWPDNIPLSHTLTRFDDKVRRIGGISRFDGRGRVAPSTAGQILILGSGAGPSDPALDVHRLGPPWVDDPWPAICRAELVVSATGQNAVADLAAAAARVIAVPQTRPFGEQVETAARLESAGLAVVSRAWPTDAEWPPLIERARALRPEWAAWQVEGAAGRAAAVIASVSSMTSHTVFTPSIEAEV